MSNKINLEFEKNSLFPFFVDYDFKRMRPRGLSSKIAFFTFGYLCDLVDNNKPYNGMLFIKDKAFVFNEGFFLIDYKDLSDNFEIYLKRFQDMGLSRIYLEKELEGVFYKFNDTNLNLIVAEIV